MWAPWGQEYVCASLQCPFGFVHGWSLRESINTCRVNDWWNWWNKWAQSILPEQRLFFLSCLSTSKKGRHAAWKNKKYQIIPFSPVFLLCKSSLSSYKDNFLKLFFFFFSPLKMLVQCADCWGQWWQLFIKSKRYCLLLLVTKQQCQSRGSTMKLAHCSVHMAAWDGRQHLRLSPLLYKWGIWSLM